MENQEFIKLISNLGTSAYDECELGERIDELIQEYLNN